MVEEEKSRRPEGDASPDGEVTGESAPVDARRPRRPARPPPGVPKTFGRYRILGVIGRGGTGIVYRAHDPKLDRDVALKVLIAGEGASAEQVERFFREAASAARLHHPNIVPIHELDVWEGKHYFTMDCVGGSGLDRIIKREGFNPRRALELAEKVARAVHHAHEQGIVHRDLKPSNIIVDERGEPHVTDFGLAKELGEEAGLTRTGTIIGTPAYMSPEQAQGRTRDVDARSDVYALGAVLYGMLTRRPPFTSDNVFELLRMAVEGDPVPPSRMGVRVSADIETICLKCLEKDPERRYRTAGELAEDCRRFLAGEPVLARRAGVWYRLRKRLWKRRALVGGVSAALVAAVFAIGFGLGFFERLSRLAAGWELVVDEDFSSGRLPAGWEVLDGGGEVREGELFVTDSRNRGFAVLLPGECPEAVRLEYEAYFPEGIELGDDNCDLSCILWCERAGPLNSGCLVQFGAAGNRRSQICRRGPEVIWNPAPAARIVPGKRHRIVAEHAGEYLTLTVDGREVLRFRDFFTLRGGRAGLYSWGKGARFDNVRLWKRGRALDVSSLAVPDAFYLEGSYRKAIDEYEAIYRSHPDAPEGRTALYKSGLARMAAGDDAGARKAFASLLDADLRGWSHIGLAELEARAGRGGAAAKELKAAEASGDPEAMAQVRANAIRLVHDAASRGDTATSVALLGTACDGLDEWETARLAERTLMSAENARKAGRTDAAVSLSRAASATFTDWPEGCANAAYGVGRALLEAERYEEAVLAYEELPKDYADQRYLCIMAGYWKGRALRSARRFDEAIRASEHVEREYADSPAQCAAAAIDIGHALREAGRAKEALRAYGRVEKDYGGQRRACAEARLWCGVVRLCLSDAAAAEADWRFVVEEYGKESLPAVRLARLFLGELDGPSFVRQLESENESYRNDPAFHVAEKLEAEGKPREAAQWYRKCLELSKGQEWPARLARRRLGELSP